MTTNQRPLYEPITVDRDRWRRELLLDIAAIGIGMAFFVIVGVLLASVQAVQR